MIETAREAEEVASVRGMADREVVRPLVEDGCDSRPTALREAETQAGSLVLVSSR